MIQIGKQPYHKTYTFPYWSDAMLWKCGLWVLVVVLPFFVVYSIPRFYLGTYLGVYNPTFTYDYHYHVRIYTSVTTYTYTTLYSLENERPMSLVYWVEDGVHQMELEWSKPMAERVVAVEMVGFFGYADQVVSGYGIVRGEVEGFDIASGGIVTKAGVRSGGDANTAPPTTNILPSMDYNLGETLQTLKRSYSAYIHSDCKHTAINMRTDKLSLHWTINANVQSVHNVTPSVLGQLVWSWTQYFSLAFLFWMAADFLKVMLFRHGLLKATISHDPSL